MMRISNCLPVIPYVGNANMIVKKSTGFGRQAITIENDYTATTTISLGMTPLIKEWVEVYLDGFRLVNSTLNFGDTHTSYEINGTNLTFNKPVTGHVIIIIDTQLCQVLPAENYLTVTNVQGAKTSSKNPGTLVATYCEPVIMSLPHSGYARITDDRMSILYVPNSNFEGFDSFSYTVLTDRGQIANPRCIFVKVGNPKTT